MIFGKIYVIHMSTTHYYKIGLTSGSIQRRIKELQTGNPFLLIPILELSVLNMRLAETILHQKYHEHRGRGEWFYINPDHDKYPESIENILHYIKISLNEEIAFRLMLKDYAIESS